jgi:phosphatidylglycerophosphate synthase
MRWGITPADTLTLVRLAALPALWALAYLELPVHLGIGVGLAGLTDVVDGPIARATGRSSRYGGQLDSFADILLMGSILLWMAWLHPSFFVENAAPLLVWAGIGVVSLLTTLARFGQLGNLHLYTAKAAGVVCYIFAVWLFVLGAYSPAFFRLAVGLAILGATETLLVAVTRDRVDRAVGSILYRGR